MIKTLAKSIREFKGKSIATPILVSFEVVLECLIPLMISKLVDAIEKGSDLSTTLKYGLVLVAMAVASLLFGLFAGITCSTASCGFARNLRRDMYYNIQDFSFENIDRFSTSSLVTRLTTDVANVQMSYMMIIRTAIRAPFMLIFAFFMSYKMGGEMSWIFVFCIPFLAFGLILIAKFAMPVFRRVFKKYDKLNSSVQENVRGIRVVKAFVREKFETEKFHDASGDICRDFTKAERILALNSPIMQFCIYSVMIFILTFGSKMVIDSSGSDLSVAKMSALLTYGFMILSSLMMLSMIFVMIIISLESAKRICEVLNEKSTLSSPENALKVVEDGSIVFDHVSFKYSEKAERNALDDVTISIKSGETIGIIGGTGSSKSTFVQLISRLYDVSSGAIFVGGRDVRDYDLEVLRNSVSVVLQKNVLFSGTIKENLLWGNPDATDEELEDAIKMSFSSEFVDRKPGRLDFMVEQGGSNFSGGQKQRLCIARALLKKPKILILDDSTSAVDTKTDAGIRKAMKEYIPETTKLIIAQRTASVEDADRIIVLDGGRINAVGTHDELLESCDIYKEVYYSQNKAGADK